MNDLQRPRSDVLDDVIEDCKSLSLEGRRHVEVYVKRQESVNYDGREPVSFSVILTYETKRLDSGLEKHPITRPETVAHLCLDADLREVLDSPGYRTMEEGIPSEVHMQVVARLASLLALQKEGAVKKVFYKHADSRHYAEVTDDVLKALSGEKPIPEKKYQICDNFAA